MLRAVFALSVMTLAAAPRVEFVFDAAPTPSCHASTLVEVKPGEFLAAWFGGTDEGEKDVAIWIARRTAAGWGRPELLVREPDTPTWNPVLFRAGDGRLWFYYKFGRSPDTWTAGRRFSRDDGRTWSPVEHLPAGIYGPIRAKPLVLADGTIVSGTSVESYRSWASWIERSRDHGVTWTRHGPITVPGEAGTGATGLQLPNVPGAGEWRRTHGIIQPAIVPLDGGRLRLFARATQNVGRIVAADSGDGGVTWTQGRPIDLPNPNSGIDVVRLKDGRYVMIYNHTAKGRSPLNLAISKDAEAWTMFHALESEPGEFSYPALIQGSDGALHMTYTWNRKKIRYVRVEVP